MPIFPGLWMYLRRREKRSEDQRNNMSERFQTVLT